MTISVNNKKCEKLSCRNLESCCICTYRIKVNNQTLQEKVMSATDTYHCYCAMNLKQNKCQLQISNTFEALANIVATLQFWSCSIANLLPYSNRFATTSKFCCKISITDTSVENPLHFCSHFSTHIMPLRILQWICNGNY